MRNRTTWTAFRGKPYPREFQELWARIYLGNPRGPKSLKSLTVEPISDASVLVIWFLGGRSAKHPPSREPPSPRTAPWICWFHHRVTENAQHPVQRSRDVSGQHALHEVEPSWMRTERMLGVGDVRLVTGLKARLPLPTFNLSIQNCAEDCNFLVNAW